MKNRPTAVKCANQKALRYPSGELTRSIMRIQDRRLLVLLFCAMALFFITLHFTYPVWSGKWSRSGTTENAALWAALGNAYLQLGDYHRAGPALYHALTFRPDHPGWLTDLGVVALELDETNYALYLFSNAIAHAPHYAPAHWYRARAYQHQGEFEKSRQALHTYHVLTGEGDRE